MKKISGKLIAAIIACVILMGTAIFGILFWDDESINSVPTVFAIDKLASEEVKLSEKSITLTTSCDSNDVDIEWSCSNMNKATIEDGVLSLREEGIIVVSAEVVGTDLRDEVVVSIINDIPTTATGIEILNKPEETLGYEDDTFYVSHRLIPESAKEEEVIYKSSNPKAVKIDEEGKVTVLAPGEADVRVALKSNPDIFDECTLDFAWDRYIGDDGTFEGKKGTVSLYSPTVEDEIKHASYNTYNPIVFKQAAQKDGTSALKITSSTTGWDSLFIKFDQKVKKGEIYNISFESEWLGEKEPTNYGHAILTSTDKWITGDDTNLMNYHRDVKWFDGNVSIPFTANADADCAYLALIVQDSEINLDMLVDNIQMSSASAVILDRAVYNDDGTFEGKKGNISLLSAHLMGLGVEGYGWSNQISLEKIKNESGNAVKVTSKGTHSIDYLYIKVDMPVKQGYKYTVKMDLEGLDEASKKGTYGYWVLSPEANLKKYIQYYSPVSSKDFLKKDAAFTFVSNGDYDSFYLLLREYTVEGEDVKFNFSIDNVRINEDGYIGQETWLNDDGTFEGTKGNISLYSPTVTSEIAKKDYHAYNSVLFKQIEKEDKTHALSVESIGTKWDTIFLKFNQQLKRGTTYTITYDAEWKGGKQPEIYNSYGYAVMPNTENWVTGNESNLVNYKNDVKWFDGKVEIVFTANADVDVWYLVLVDQNKDIPIQMTIDNVKVSAEKYPVMNSVLNDDGTFEGIPGNFSFYSISELDKTKLNANCAFQNNVSTFQKVDTDNGTAMAVKTTGTRASMVYVKIKEALVAGNEYEFSYNAKWLGDSLEGINYGYAILPTIANWVTTSNANLEDNILNYTKTPNAFDGDFSITFKPAKNYEECYFVLFIQSKEVLVDMLVDNVKFEQKVQVGEPIVENILNDDGTFEGNEGNVSLYNTKLLQGSYNYGKTTADIEFQKVNVGGNTKLSVKTAETSNANVFKMMYIKIDKVVKKGQLYRVSLDMIPQTDAYKNGSWKVTFCSSGNPATLDSLGARTTVSDPVAFFGEKMNLEFTAKDNSDYIYMVIWEYGGTKESLEFLMDNIKVTTEYAAEQSVLNDDGTFEGKTGNISLYNTKHLQGSYNYNSAVADITFQKLDVNNNTKLHVKTAEVSSVNVFKMMYIKIDRYVKKGQLYKVSLDMIPQTDAYKNGNWKVTFCSSGSPATLDSLGARTTVGDPATFFGKDMNLEFIAKENSDCIYMVIWEYGGSKESYEFLMDNIKVTTEYAAEQSIINDDGTFEGRTGNISVYNTKYLPGSYNYNGIVAEIAFQKLDVNNNTKLHVKTAETSNANIFKMMYVKIDKYVKKGQTYNVLLDMVPQTDTYKNGSWKVTFCSSANLAALDSLGARTTVSDPTTFFGKDMNLEFTAKENSDCIYMVIWEYGGSKESYEFLMDNIKVTTEYVEEQSIINDDGTFEGRNGSISIYNTKYLDGSYNYNKSVAEITFRKVDVNNNTKLYVKTSATSSVNVFKMMYIKIDSEVTKGQTYEVSLDMVPQTDTYKKGGWKVTFCSSTSPATLDSLGARTTVSAPTTFFGENMNLQFTAKENSDCIYMVIWEYGGSNESFEFLVDNIKVQTK